MKKILTFGFAALLSCSAFAQGEDSEEDKSIKIDVTIVKDGETKHIVKEITSGDIANLKDVMSDLAELEDIDIDVEDGEVRVMINKSGTGTSSFNFPSNFGFYSHSEDTDKAFLGVHVQNENKDEESSRVEVVSVIPETGAEDAGLKKGDIILEFDGEKVNDYREFVEAIASKKQGDKVDILIERDGKTETVQAELGQRKATSYSYFSNDDFEFEFDDEDGVFSEKMRAKIESMKDHAKRGFMGIGYETEDDGVVKITSVYEGSGAEDAGIEVGDELVEIDGVQIHSGEDVRKALEDKKPGDKIRVEFNRDGKKKSEKIELGTRKHFVIGSRSINRNHYMPHHWLDDDIQVYVKIAKVTDEDKEMLEKALGKNISNGNAFNNLDINLYPNPGNGKYNYEISLEDRQDVELKVLDMSGRSVYEQKLSDFSGTYSGSFNISEETNGNYFLIISQGDKIHTEKLIKE